MERLDELIVKLDKMFQDIAILKSYINSESGNNIHHLDEYYKQLKKHDDTLYGNGNPGLTTKIEGITSLRKMIADHAKIDALVFTILVTLQLAIFGKLFLMH